MDRSGAEYEIRIKSTIGPEWNDWFDNMQIISENPGETVLRGRIRDQAELHGVLDRLSDLNLVLISVNRIDGEENHSTYLSDSKE